MRPTNTARNTKAMAIRRMTSTTARPKAWVKRVEPPVEPGEEAALGGRRCAAAGRRTSPGVSVRATKPEIATEMAMVIANCL